MVFSRFSLSIRHLELDEKTMLPRFTVGKVLFWSSSHG